MGIGGHMLGEKKLRRLSRLTGLHLDRAYIRNGHSEGRVVMGPYCYHYSIDPKTGERELLLNPTHWTSCPRRER